MFQTFDSTSSPAQGPARLRALRGELEKAGLAGFIVPRADAHQGEYVAARDERLQWLTGFTGSAGFCIVLPDKAGVFIDGRYRTQVKGQVDQRVFTPVPWPDVLPGPWIVDNLKQGVIGYDSWLHTPDEIAKIAVALEGHPVTLASATNFVDVIWPDQPAAPVGRAFIHPIELAGESSSDKRNRLAEVLVNAGQKTAVLTLPDSICWLLNIRGSDVPRNPILHGFALLHDTGRVTLFADPAKFDAEVKQHLGTKVDLQPTDGFLPSLCALQGVVRVDRTTAPIAVSTALAEAGIAVAWGDDPCRLPKARKNEHEIEGMRAAHLRDAGAVVEFLARLDVHTQAAGGNLTEIDVVNSLEGFRRATNMLHDISFDTICGSGPNGAIMHYRVTDTSNRVIGSNELLLVDSGAQYRDGTTDITRTVAVGDPGLAAREAFTRVLQGMIAISRVRWPKGLAGRDLDGFARYHLWLAGQDFNHGTGHGVGAFLSVHEGPQRLSRISEVPLEVGMILSNEPGYYLEGKYGIRLENLIVVRIAPMLPGGDDREQLSFETLTLAPFDRRLILVDALSPGERTWLNAYHAKVSEMVGPRVSDFAKAWLVQACAAL
ncbi:MAG: aminopeptidase P family protein [Paracoccaceae bacterium]